MMLHVEKLNDRVEFARIAGVGHSLQYEDPDAFLATIVPYIRAARACPNLTWQSPFDTFNRLID